jgi:outer membrane protein TolC
LGGQSKGRTGDSRFKRALELKNAYLSLKNAIARIDSTESDLKVYKDNFIIVKEKYDQGIASTLDINDANLKFNVSMFNKKQAIYDYIVANSNFDKATGGL